MFKQTYLKLTGLYLAIIMTISLSFSISIYQLSTQEISRGLRSPENIILSDQFGVPQYVRNRVQQERQVYYAAAQQRVINRLVLVNLMILFGGGLLSYYLARRTLRPIEEAHEAQSRFTADASHELRTPIAAMRAETEVALMDPKFSPTAARTLLKSNLEELDKLTSLSEGLLRLAQLENNDLQRDDVRIDSVIENAVNRVLNQAEKKDILVSYKSTKDVVVGDAASLTEAVVILLDNAIKYSSDKTHVEVTTVKSQKGVEVQVSDAGIGIKATELPHIFDRFYRADSSRSKQTTNGYGIGLAIAKNIIEQHGGSIQVKSKPGKGSTFTITLPAK